MATNVEGRRIDLRGLALRGAEVGVVSAVIMAAIAMIVSPIVGGGIDEWSFPKSVATIVMGSSAVQHLAGFSLGTVVAGLILHLAIGAIVGAVFAMLIGMFDVEEPAPIVIAGLVYSGVVYVLTWVLLGNIAFSTLTKIPVVVIFWSYATFGLVAGAMLSTWDRSFDHGIDEHRARPIPVTTDDFANVQHKESPSVRL